MKNDDIDQMIRDLKLTNTMVQNALREGGLPRSPLMMMLSREKVAFRCGATCPMKHGHHIGVVVGYAIDADGLRLSLAPLSYDGSEPESHASITYVPARSCTPVKENV